MNNRGKGLFWLARQNTLIRFASLASVAVLVVLGFLFNMPTQALTTTTSTDVNLTINSVISLSIESCDTSAPDYQTNT
ncbi:hypothetical protein FWH58_03720, partial [Candidatus Saccharibacteria bacterium]|nr:hypothetical protein [Candidatus Saccharibacteria bacterium]